MGALLLLSSAVIDEKYFVSINNNEFAFSMQDIVYKFLNKLYIEKKFSRSTSHILVKYSQENL